MGIKSLLQKFLGGFSISIFAVWLLTSPSYAASGTLRVSPQSGTYQVGQTFDVSIVADGGGELFNAAKALVIISPSLKVENITLGNCGFAYVRTPSPNDPSFVGVILGGSSSSCVVDTLSLQAVQPGSDSITLVSGSIMSYKGAHELASNTQSAIYSIAGTGQQTTANTITPTTAPITTKQGDKLYTILAHISVPNSYSSGPLKAVLDPNLPTQKEVLATVGNTLPDPVVFDRVPQGVHIIAVFSSDQEVSQQIITVGGNNGTIVFGISKKATTPAWVWYALGGIILLLIYVVGFIIYKKRRYKPVATV